jgi:hypothetical protein
MGPTETTSIGTVPASVSSASVGGHNEVDMGVLLQQIQGDTATQQRLMREAITPVSGSHVGQIPSALTKPIGEAPQSQTPYERPRSKGEAISNMINSAGNAVSKVITAEKEQKQTHLTDAATKLFTAQAAIDEAQQQHDSATAIGDNATAQKAQQLIDQNIKVRDGITSDPKLRKALAKGLNIDYIDPSNNKTEEHAAVQAAIKNAKTIQEKRQLAKQAQQQHQQQANQQGAQNFGTAFAKAQPQTLAPNQMAQAQYSAYVEAQKANLSATRALIPLLSAQVRANANESLETRREAHTDNLALMKSQDSWERLNANISARQDLAKTQFGYRLREIAAEGSKELAVFKAKLVEKNADPLTSVKAYQDFQTKSAITKSKLAEAVSTLQVQRDAAAKQKPYNESMVSNLDQQLSVAKQAQTTYGQAVDGISTWYKKIAGVSEEDKSNGSKSSSSSLSSASTYLPDSAADPDEDEDNDY